MIDYPTVERALRSADPEALPEAVRAVLLTMGVSGVEVYLADYALRVLAPVGGLGRSGTLPIHASVEGKAFASQRPQFQRQGDGTTIVTVPVTVRGDRHGTLSAVLPADVTRSDASDASDASKNAENTGTAENTANGASAEGSARAVEVDSTEVETLQAVARLLGHEIVVADRDTDRYQQARRATRLTLAAETQWQLLPGRSSRRREYALGAQLEPAYAIRGDSYDWAATSTDLTLAVVNGMGEGISAALLTSLAVNGLRNARRAGLDLADQAALADQAVYAQHQGELYVSALLLCFAYDTGEVTVVDAGSPQIWLRRGRSVERIDVDAQLPLGMFEETAYTPQKFQVLPGDRLVIVSDGAHAAVSPGGEVYGHAALQRGINSSGLLPAEDVPTAILREVSSHRSVDADDDVVVVCVDWYGRSGAGD
ncbi:protein serine/threonine phosphatase [Catenulispora acidiphila DSM 44928]|uniref:Protein serine/threonine phosphatase n=1 Tax=Catenulispora acidiphila (strain DSM 44928 / JCM 14897 / NBRC 102108 / NRRL B-24433 / ID139908) TaxID=479433 RepID=C7QGD3_CATAD|nr:PP2C family protein-serine/threonine phosphatase [Catenulispora acidiphila]ACU72978.1 protein serine/threonine phosphatase [Catenulispora acidiphila DSM 44928]